MDCKRADNKSKGQNQGYDEIFWQVFHFSTSYYRLEDKTKTRVVQILNTVLNAQINE
jgi:hypothetical protein